jgi:hypothetical protein
MIGACYPTGIHNRNRFCRAAPARVTPAKMRPICPPATGFVIPRAPSSPEALTMSTEPSESSDPFHRIGPRLKWLEARDRRVWGGRIFAAAVPHLDGHHAAHNAAGLSP